MQYKKSSESSYPVKDISCNIPEKENRDIYQEGNCQINFGWENLFSLFTCMQVANCSENQTEGQKDFSPLNMVEKFTLCTHSQALVVHQGFQVKSCLILLTTFEEKKRIQVQYFYVMVTVFFNLKGIFINSIMKAVKMHDNCVESFSSVHVETQKTLSPNSSHLFW